jgi:hypothetical protein
MREGNGLPSGLPSGYQLDQAQEWMDAKIQYFFSHVWGRPPEPLRVKVIQHWCAKSIHSNML